MYKVDFNSPKHFHFIGIGGVSMSGLAEVLLKRGFEVSGSDNVESEYTDNLIKQGAKVYFPQRADNIKPGTDCVVYSAAIKEDNEEFISAVNAGLPMLTRAQFLGQLMNNFDESIAVAGTHGKTTTTSMISQVLLELPEDPTITVGGNFSAINGNIHVGDSNRFITEACEYTNSYHEFFAKYSVILNVEADHLDFFKDIDDIRKSFNKFANNTLDDGCLIINKDIEKLSDITKGVKSKIVTFGIDDNADYYAADIEYARNGCAVFVPVHNGKRFSKIQLKVPGEHNVYNAIAAFALCNEMGVDEADIKLGLEKYTGTDRRFEFKGNYQGTDIFDDYAHHPTEIEVTLKMAKTLPYDRVVVIFQPHTYTRTKALLKELAESLSHADVVVLAKIYPAREKDIYNISSKDLLKEIEKLGVETYYFDTFSEIEKFISKKCMNNDLLITMGAGDIVNVGNELLEK
ncbi:MAG: UDP-N-acetylmuramate--L-alanine ligase [Lachnospiraceae bacterium]|nr:UDP-N-acetylmuramate--L-alanine ligase [Lachnospiraceae bacterium]